MQSDSNFLVIRVPRMYATKVQDLSCGRIVGEAIRLIEAYSDFDLGEGDLEAINHNIEELQHIKNAVDAFSSAVREGIHLELHI